MVYCVQNKFYLFMYIIIEPNIKINPKNKGVKKFGKFVMCTSAAIAPNIKNMIPVIAKIKATVEYNIFLTSFFIFCSIVFSMYLNTSSFVVSILSLKYSLPISKAFNFTELIIVDFIIVSTE
jgi:hypothetical protein